MNEKLRALQSFLNNNTIPKPKKRPKTFLGIAKQPHYENVLSNIYAFFFNVSELHKLEDLFVKSLLELIAASKLGVQKETLQAFNNFDIETEYRTKKGGRIDLLLSNGEQAIIIENKVYHHIHGNDLDDYWDSVDIINCAVAHKIGVILSLEAVPEASYCKWEQASQYVNITHLELLECVMKNSGAYLLNARDKYVMYLKDLYQNIINISSDFMKAEEVQFYLDNQQEINDLAKFKAAIRKQIALEVVKASQSIEGVNLYSPRINSDLGQQLKYFTSTVNANLMFTIIYGGLLNPQRELKIIVEVQGAFTKNRALFKNIEFTSLEQEMIKSDFYTLNQNWLHFASSRYILSNKEYMSLSGFISDKLQGEGLMSIFRKMEQVIAKSNVT